MAPVTCPMGCGAAWSDAALLRCLQTTQASEQVHKRRRLHLEIQLRRELREEIEAEIKATQRSPNDNGSDQDLHQGIVTEALELLMDKCRKCGQAFSDDWDGCMALHCPCGSYVCAYCLMVGTEEIVHEHIGSNSCPVRLQMFPEAANGDTFHQGPTPKREFAIGRRIRIVDELHTYFRGLQPAQRALLAQRIRRDVEDNGVDFSLVYDTDEQQL